MSQDYNARTERAGGRKILDDAQRLIYFGPGRDSTALTGVVLDILHLEGYYGHPQGEQEKVFQRTESGKHFWVKPGFAKAIGIETTNVGGIPAAGEADTENRDLATIHDTVEGVIRYVHLRAVFPGRIIPRLRQAVIPGRELATPLSPPEVLEESPMAPVIQLHPPELAPAEIPPASVAL
jgi:hypothetical protein